MSIVGPPYPLFVGVDNRLLDNGYVYIGLENEDPETDPAPIFADSAMTIPLAQPLRTKSGVLADGDNPTSVYTANRYSIRICNSTGAEVYYEPSAVPIDEQIRESLKVTVDGYIKQATAAKNLAEFARQGAEDAAAAARSSEVSAEVDSDAAQIAAAAAAQDANAAAASLQAVYAAAMGPFANTTDGIAGTSSGEYFLVLGTGDVFSRLFLNNAGTPVDQGLELPSRMPLERLESDRSQLLGRRRDPVQAPNPISGPLTYLFVDPVTAASQLKSVKLYVGTTGTLKIKKFSYDSGANTYTQTGSASVVIGTTGMKTLTPSEFGVINLAVGDRLGFYTTGGMGTYSATPGDGNGYVSAAGDATSIGGGSPVTSVRLEVQFATSYIDYPVTGPRFDVLESQAVRNEELRQSLSGAITFGRATVALPSGGSSSTEGTYIFANALPSTGGTIKSFRAYGGSSGGTFTIRLYQRTGSSLVSTGVEAQVSVTANTAVEVPIDLEFAGGEYVGVSAPANGFMYEGGAADEGGWYFGGFDIFTYTISGAPATSALLQLGFTLDVPVVTADAFRDLEERVLMLELALANGGGFQLPMTCVADGNSLTAGTGGATPWATLLAADTGLTVVNKGVSGQNIQQMIDDAATDIDPLAVQLGKRTVIIVDGEPFNWLRGQSYVSEAAAVTAAVSKIEEYCLARRAAGFDLVVVVNSGAHNTATNDVQEGNWNRLTTKSALNAEFAARWPDFADAIVDIGALSALSNYADSTYYQGDQVHYTTAGQTAVKDAIKTVLASL